MERTQRNGTKVVHSLILLYFRFYKELITFDLIWSFPQFSGLFALSWGETRNGGKRVGFFFLENVSSLHRQFLKWCGSEHGSHGLACVPGFSSCVYIDSDTRQRRG